MSFYQENKIFINKFKSALEAEYRNEVFQRSITLSFNDDIPNMRMRIACLYDSKVYIAEAGKRLYFCIKLKDGVRSLGSAGADIQDNIPKLSVRLFLDSLSRYSTSRDYINKEIRKYLADKGVTNVGRGDIHTIDEYDLMYWIKDNPDYINIKDFPEAKRYEGIVKELLECPMRIYRHPDVHKAIKENDLIPVAWLEQDNYNGYLLVYPKSSANSVKATGFLNKVTLESAIEGGIRKLAHRTYVYAPVDLWAILVPASSILNEKYTLSYNYSI